MKRPILPGLVFIVAGIACIFPFIRALVFENIMIMIGIYLTYRGYLYLTAPIQDKKDSISLDKSSLSGKKSSCESDCNKPPL